MRRFPLKTKMQSLLLTMLLMSLTPTYANDNSDQSIIEQMRPHVEALFGEKWTLKLFGAPKNQAQNKPEVELPKIPLIDQSATSLAVYNKKEDSIKIDPTVAQKFNYVYIRELFEATRQEKPNENDMAKMMNILSQGGTRDGVYRSLVLDATYGGMENWDKPVKSNSADFAVYFYETYLGRKIKKKSFEGMSIYTLKRLITERALEVAAAFEDRDSLERWYAVLSGDIAQKFPLIWPNEMRKNPSAKAHKDWAAHVPMEHIKSELIIKIHSSFNSMI